MKKVIPLLIFLVFYSFPVFSQTSETEGSKAWRWGLVGSIEMGAAFVDETAFASVMEAGYGSIETQGMTVNLTAGADLRKPDFMAVDLLVTYMGGGSFMWTDIFGSPDESFPLMSDSWSVQIEIQPLFEFLHGFHPFIGGGYSFTNSLMDEAGDGFKGGTGPFVSGGLLIINNFGLGPGFPAYSTSQSYFGIRISANYRFPYSYGFNMDWDEYSEGYTGPSDLSEMRSFFESESFPADCFSFSIGFSMGYMPDP